MVLGHIGTWHENHRLPDQAELADGAGSGAAYHQVGGLVGGSHVGNEVHLPQVGQLAIVLQCPVHFLIVVFTRLPDELHVGRCLHHVEMLAHAFVYRAGPERASHEQDGLLVWVEAELPAGLLRGDVGIQHILAHGVSRHDDFLFREEPLHVVVGHADFVGLLGQ